MRYLLFFEENFCGLVFLYENCAAYGNYLRKSLIFNRKIIKYIGYIYIHFRGDRDETHFSAQQKETYQQARLSRQDEQQKRPPGFEKPKSQRSQKIDGQ
jgi:hypothetical protein